MKKICVGNMKGGVGKTTTTIAIADSISAINGARVLVMDLDPQANLSWALLGPTLFENQSEAATLTRWLGQIVEGSVPELASTLKQVGLRKLDSSGQARLTLAASNSSLRITEMKLEGPAGGEGELAITRALDASLSSLQGSFDVVVMDCSPAMSAFTRAGLRLADCVIAPTPANRLCFESLKTFENQCLRGLVGNNCDLHVIITRKGAAQGKHEQGAMAQLIRERYSTLAPDIPERKEYMKALDPPERGAHSTLRERYGSRIDDIRRLAKSIKEKGIL